jgi:hypothetical protein
MANFSIRDLGTLKREGLEAPTIRMSVAHAIDSSEEVRADLQKFDAQTGQYEITISGILKPEFLGSTSVIK